MTSHDLGQTMRLVTVTPGACEIRLDHCENPRHEELDTRFDLYLRVDEESPAARNALVCLSADNLRDLRYRINDLLEEAGEE